MLAELHGKLDPSSTDAVERSEDLLTDAVFGSIRHLPRVRVLGAVLAAAGIAVQPRELERADVRLWPWLPMTMWPGTGIEPDVIVIAGRRTIVFEAKLHSQFGMYVAPGDETGRVFHQLAVQYAAVASWAAGERLAPPVVVAVTPSAAPPEADLAKARADLCDLTPGADPNLIGWISWRRIAEVLDALDGLHLHERQLVDDVLAFMDKRGVRRMFKGFRREDYWLLSAAQLVAADRLYPEIQTFLQDVAAVLADDGITWSQPGNKAVLTNAGVAIANPTDWTRSFLGAAYWPERWPERVRQGSGAYLYVAFDFVDPALEAGVAIAGPGASRAQEIWAEHISAVTTELNALRQDFPVCQGDVRQLR